MKKRGISAVIASVLLIMITVLALMMLWLFVLPMVSTIFSEINIDLRIVNVGYTGYDPSTGFMFVQVERGFDDSTLENVEFNFNFNGNSIKYHSERIPAPGARVLYYFNFAEDCIFGENIEISVAPVVMIEGEKVIGQATSKIDSPVGDYHLSESQLDTARSLSETPITPRECSCPGSPECVRGGLYCNGTKRYSCELNVDCYGRGDLNEDCADIGQTCSGGECHSGGLLICADYPGQCGSSMPNGGGGTINCITNCNALAGETCNASEMCESPYFYWWTMDDFIGDIIIDRSGHQNATIMNGGGNELVDGYFTIDGDDEYALVSQGVDLGLEDYTVSMWVRSSEMPEQLVGHNFGILGFWGGDEFYGWGGQPYHYIVLDGPLQKIRTRFNFVGSNEDIYADSEGDINNWHHLAVSVSREGEATLFIDNVSQQNPVDLEPYSSIPLSNNHNFTIGRIGNDHPEYPSSFKGDIDNVIVYKGAFSEEEINEVYDAQCLVYGVCGSFEGKLNWESFIPENGFKDRAYGIQPLGENYLIVGETQTEDGNDHSYNSKLRTVDSLGNIVSGSDYDFNWNTYADYLYKIQQAPGGYIAAGSKWLDFPANKEQFFLVKIDSSGEVDWNKTYGTSSVDIAYDVINTSDGGYIASGYLGGDAGLLKVYSDGAQDWMESYGSAQGDSARSVIELNDGSFVFAGKYGAGSVGSDDFWLAKISNSGVLIWDETYGGSRNEEARKLLEMEDGGFLLIGYRDTLSAEEDIMMVKTDSSGNEEWTKFYEGPWMDYATDAINYQGGAVITGWTEVPNGGYKALVFRIDEVGNNLWNWTTLGESVKTYSRSIIETEPGKFVIAGQRYQSSINGIDFWYAEVEEVNELEV